MLSRGGGSKSKYVPLTALQRLVDRYSLDEHDLTSSQCHPNKSARPIKTRAVESSDMPQYADVTYTVEVITTYKDDGGISGDTLSFTTTASSSLCGISLEIGGGDEEGLEYLVDLRRIGSTDELRAVGLCGAFKEWSDDDAAILEGGCASTLVPVGTSVLVRN